MAWNEDDWRLAAEAFNTALESAQAAQRASATVAAEDPEMAQRLERGGAQQGRDAQIALTRLLAFPSLPTTEPEARRAITAAREWKARFNNLDGRLMTAGNAGRIMTRDDRAAINAAGFQRARELLVMVPWAQVSRMMAVRMTAPRQPAVPRQPGTTRRRRRGGGAMWLPLIILGAVLLSGKK